MHGAKCWVHCRSRWGLQGAARYIVLSALQGDEHCRVLRAWQGMRCDEQGRVLDAGRDGLLHNAECSGCAGRCKRLKVCRVGKVQRTRSVCAGPGPNLHTFAQLIPAFSRLYCWPAVWPGTWCYADVQRDVYSTLYRQTAVAGTTPSTSHLHNHGPWSYAATRSTQLRPPPHGVGCVSQTIG